MLIWLAFRSLAVVLTRGLIIIATLHIVPFAKLMYNIDKQ